MSDKDIMAPEAEHVEYVPDPARIAEIEERLATIRLSMLFHIPFWGQLAVGLKLQDASGWCKTAATDGRKFYYNVDFIDSLTDAEVQFLFGHEIEHCAFSHMLRRENRNPVLWNVACDFAVNLDLVDGGIGDRIECGLYDTKYKGMTAEEIFEDLIKDEESMQQAMSLQTLDEHLDGEGDDDGDAKDDEYKAGDENNRPSVGKDVKEQIGREMRSAVTNAAKQAEMQNKAGSIPTGMRRLIKSWSKPTVDWRNYIQNRIMTTIQDDFTFSRPNRRGELPGGLIPPGRDRLETVIAHIAIDTSGSMTETMLRDLMGEVVGVMSLFPEVEIHIWCFDGDVINESYKVFDSSNLDEIYEYELLGGGGTDFMANWDWMKANEIVPKTLLFFTDGYPCGEWGDPKYCPTIYLIHGCKAGDIVAPFGTTLYYEPKRKTS